MKEAREKIGDGKYNVSSVYIIFRIFNIDKETLDVKVYVDPWKLIGNGELRIIAGEWTVVPG